MSRRIEQSSMFGASVEWENLPIVGADRARRDQRARAWQRIGLVLATGWIGAIGALVWLVLR